MNRVWTALLLVATVVVASAVVYVLVHQDPVPNAGQSLALPTSTAASPTPSTSLTPGTSTSVSDSPISSGSASLSGSTSTSGTQRTIAFIGDNWTHGAGVGGAEQAFPALLGTALGTRTAVEAQNGAGYAKGATGSGNNYVDLAGEFGTISPAIIVVSGGRNDISDDPDTLADAADDLFAGLKSDFPQAKLVAVAPFWGDSAHPSDLDMVDSAVQDAVTSAGGTYLDIPDPLADHPEWMADEANPNAKGNEAIADALQPELAKLLPSG